MGFLNKYIKIYWRRFMAALVFLTIEALCDLLQPTIMSRIVDHGVAGKDMTYVLSMGGVMLLVTAIGAGAAVGRNSVSSIVSQKFGAQLRGDLFKKIQSFSLGDIDKFYTASLITRLTNDITQVQNFAHGMMRIFVKAPILCIGSLIMAFLINPHLAVVLLGIVPIIGLIIFINMRVSYPFFRRIQSSLDNVNSVMREYLAGVRVVKAFNRYDYEVERFQDANRQLTDVSVKGMRAMALFNPAITLTVNTGIVLILWFGGLRVSDGNMQVGQIIAFINYMTQILFSLVMLSHVFNMFIRAKASAERIDEVFSQESTMKADEHSMEKSEIKGRIDFENVTFAYDGNDNEPVLKNVSFTCLPGETIGIIGPTASGKSSLVNLIPRFYDVSSGTVKVDGIDVRDMDIKELRQAVGIVPQKTVLFTGTILENIKWGNDDAGMDEVEKASILSQAHEFISAFPEGYKTVLGQGGVNLSGGQKQRLSIARALIKKLKVLILDDSTSAVDAATEAKIREGLKEYIQDATCIVIAQRITSVMGADRIVVLDSGSVAGMGTHEELLESCRIYQDIFRSQIGRREQAYA
ncbi:ABC transporter ATP-binding protein [Lutispora saccharofermentans]|uniref:ABC transporter ATP-binding protein/permease n=1 Tax=Lutispora saccharofermentans TaxID=3024236 RepID=A0ABT1NEG1_9FIRM|nr:ABC transporter ATP-binding protein [Lutispora saccharofermentans]MCQ1529637.1 ABC transporter ATP-binding protein/permease [Lutispora saccharofermentans]